MKELVKGIGLISIVIVVFFSWIHTDKEVVAPSKEEIKEEVKEDKKKETQKKEQKVHVTRQDGSELHLSMDDYLRGVVSSEMSASFEMEALKAQCVAARTFVSQRGFKVDDTTRTQVYHDDKQLKKIWGSSYGHYSKRIKQAVKDTSKEVLTYKGKLISAVFFSGSCGKTANSEEYWEDKSPYLRSVDSKWDKKEKGYQKTNFFSDKAFREKLGFQNNITEIEAPKFYDSGYVKSIRIDHISFSGRAIRELLGLRSSCFSIHKTKGGYSITTKGYGHGLGLSQYGAQGMALEKASYMDILHHYYTNVKIEKRNV